MNYGILQEGIVVNAVLADASYAAQHGWIALPDGVGIGWSYDGLQFAPPDRSKTAVPVVVSMRQARLALLAAGHLSKVDAALAALPSPRREAAAIEWEYATDVRRHSDLVTSVGQAIGLDAAELDALFIHAATL